MAQRQEKLDSIIRVVTPENIGFEYRIAGPFRRLPAFLIDLAIIGVIDFVLTLIFQLTIGLFSPGTAIFAIRVTYFIMFWFYGGVAETFMNGQTPGKWLLGLRVVTYECQPINGLQAMMRNLLRAADLIVPVVGIVVMMLNRRYQRLGDLVAGTIVVIEERHWLSGVAKLDDLRAIQLAAYLPPNFVVTRSLARALATYVERRRFFSQPRRREVAKHLAEPLLARFGLPHDTSYDLLLCSLYYRKFIADRGDDEQQLAAAAEAVRAQNPWAGMQTPAGYPSPYGAPAYGYGPQPGYYPPSPYGAPAYGGQGYAPPPALPPLPQTSMVGTGLEKQG